MVNKSSSELSCVWSSELSWVTKSTMNCVWSSELCWVRKSIFGVQICATYLVKCTAHHLVYILFCDANQISCVIVNRFRLCSSAINSKRNIVQHLEVASTKEMLSKFL